jgi:hypothetical protein
MLGVFPAPGTVFGELQPLLGIFLVLIARIIFSLANRARQSDNLSHFTVAKPPNNRRNPPAGRRAQKDPSTKKLALNFLATCLPAGRNRAKLLQPTNR